MCVLSDFKQQSGKVTNPEECDMARAQHILKAARKTLSTSILGLGKPMTYCYKPSCPPQCLERSGKEFTQKEGDFI